jgi:hypothetical protein
MTIECAENHNLVKWSRGETLKTPRKLPVVPMWAIPNQTLRDSTHHKIGFNGTETSTSLTEEKQGDDGPPKVIDMRTLRFSTFLPSGR